ncbi:MAG TPA: DUF6325 family protein [Candidatus Limnocylindrales bacterium]|nr:DUF6325 family protein [Candidatus Limnocylindrales bacterium]
MALGPLEYLVVGFTDDRFDGSIAREIQKVVDAKVIRLIDVALVSKDRAGTTTVMEINRTSDPALSSLSALLGDGVRLFTPDDLDEIAKELPEGTSGAVFLFEHRWAEDIRDAMQAKGGFLVDRVVIPSDVVEQIDAEMETPELVPAG